MNKTMKSILSVFMSVVMLASTLFPITAFAAEEASTKESTLFSTSYYNSLLHRAVINGLTSSEADIKAVAFVDLGNYDLTGVSTADYSSDGSGSILGWVDSETSTLYIGGYGKIIAGASLAGAFRDGASIDSISGLSMLDTSNVTDMSTMFEYCGKESSNFTLDLGPNFDTSNVTNMKGMFTGCGYNSTVFTLDLGDKFNTSNVTKMRGMFRLCGYNSTVFTLDLGDKFNTSNVTDMSDMFEHCGKESSNFTLDLGPNFDTSNVTNMSYMFDSCGYNSTVFTLDLGDKFNTSNVTDMSEMFYRCGYNDPNFTLDLGPNFDTSNVTIMTSMFEDCGYSSTVFTLNLGDKFNTSNVTKMSGMFDDCGYKSKEFTLDLGDKFDTSKVKNMSYLFGNCGVNSPIFTLDLGPNFDTSNVTNMNHMFTCCGYSSTVFTLDLGDKFNTSNVTDMSDMFYYCGYNSTVFTLDLGPNFDTSNVMDMSNMFYYCGYNDPNFTLDLGPNFDTSNVTDMSFMFYSCGYSSSVFTTLDLSSFTVSNSVVLRSFAGYVPVTKIIFGEGWAQAKLPTSGAFYVPSSEPRPTTIVGATENLRAYNWVADHREPIFPDMEIDPVFYTVTAEAGEGGTVSGSGKVEEGASITLTAAANDGYTFDGWYEGETKVCDTADFVVTNVAADKIYTAKFTKNQVIDPKPDFNFTSIRTARANSITVNHENKTITMNADSNVKNVIIYRSQLDVIPGGTVTLADAAGTTVKQNSGSFYIINNAGTASVIVDVTIDGVTQQYNLSVSFSAFVANNLRVYQRRAGSTTKDIVYGTDVGYVVNDEIHITPNAGIEYVGLTKYQGTPGNYNGIITPAGEYPTYSTFEESVAARDAVYVDWQGCIFVKRPVNGGTVQFDVNYELNGESSIYKVFVDFSEEPFFDFTSIRTSRAKNITVDHAAEIITMDSDGRVDNIAVYQYQLDKINGGQITLADALDASIKQNSSSFYILDDGTGSSSVVVNVKVGDTVKQYTLTVNFSDGFDFTNIRTLRTKNTIIDHNAKTITVDSDGKVSNIAILKEQLDIIPDGIVTLADAMDATITQNSGSFYISDDGSGSATVLVDVAIAKTKKQYTLTVNFSDGFDFDEIRTLRASEISVDHTAQKITLTAQSGANNVALYMAQTGVINGGKLIIKNTMDANIKTNSGSYYIMRPNDGQTETVEIDMTIGGKTKTYELTVVF